MEAYDDLISKKKIEQAVFICIILGISIIAIIGWTCYCRIKRKDDVEEQEDKLETPQDTERGFAETPREDQNDSILETIKEYVTIALLKFV